MTRNFIFAALSTILAATSLTATSASAGGCGGRAGFSIGGGGYHAFTPARAPQKSYAAVRRAKPQQTARLARPAKVKPAIEVAAAETKAPTTSTPVETAAATSAPAVTETGSSALAAGSVSTKTAETTTAEPVEVAAADQTTCTRFIPALGTTVEVACEKN